jgi:hypothetical protein
MPTDLEQGTKGLPGPLPLSSDAKAGIGTMAAFPELCDELAVADRDVTEGQERIARQAEVVCELDAQGHDTNNAQNLLATMQQSLDAVNADRQQIVHELASARGEEL